MNPARAAASQTHAARHGIEPARIYIEPTNTCNLGCRMCVRNVWQEAPGQMSAKTYQRVLDGVQSLHQPPLVFFGGFGEPLAHPEIITMASQAARAGAAVELITNGVLLTPAVIDGLAAARVRRLWVSLDGATRESYADVRLGAELPAVLANLRSLGERRARDPASTPALGIAFVAMRRNIDQLAAVIRIGQAHGADRFSISNLLPHTAAHTGEVLYRRSLYRSRTAAYLSTPALDLPPMDADPRVLTALWEFYDPAITGPKQSLVRSCPFFEKNSLSVRWDGEVSPCLPLLHDHRYYLDDRPRWSPEKSFGNLNRAPLLEIWRSSAYASFRERLAQFDFSPCVMCNACEMADANLEDCFGNSHPTCGGCLWAHGFIRCP